MKKLIISGLFCLLIASSALADDVWVENDTLHISVSLNQVFDIIVQNCDPVNPGGVYWMGWNVDPSCTARQPLTDTSYNTKDCFAHFKILSADSSCLLVDMALSSGVSRYDVLNIKTPLDEVLQLSNISAESGSSFTVFNDFHVIDSAFQFERDETYQFLLSDWPEDKCAGGYNIERFHSMTQFTIPCCRGIRGNADNDPNDIIDIMDLDYMVDYQFRGGPAPECFNEGDVTVDGIIDIEDLVYLIDYSNSNGPAPGSCDD